MSRKTIKKEERKHIIDFFLKLGINYNLAALLDLDMVS